MIAGSIKALVMSTSGAMNDGITSWMRQTFAAMDQSNLELTTLAFYGAPNDIVASVRNVGFDVLSVPSRKTNPKAYAAAFRRILEEEDFDIVHVSCNSALASFELREAKLHGVPMRIAHSHNTTCQHKVVDRLLRPIFYQELTDCYACGSDAGKWLFEGRPFTVIPNGKELDDWAFSSINSIDVRSELGLSNQDIVIGHVGRFNKQKNHEKLLHIFAELRRRSNRYRLVLVGDGNLFERTKILADQLGIGREVLFLGRRNDVPRILNGLDCMVFPSLYEGFPNVVLEWQLSGLPVVMSDTITDDVAITSLVKKLYLSASDAYWADEIESSLIGRDRTADSVEARKEAKRQGYDIHDDAALLRGLYFQGVKRNGCN